MEALMVKETVITSFAAAMGFERKICSIFLRSDLPAQVPPLHRVYVATEDILTTQNYSTFARVCIHFHLASISSHFVHETQLRWVYRDR